MLLATLLYLDQPRLRKSMILYAPLKNTQSLFKKVRRTIGPHVLSPLANHERLVYQASNLYNKA